MKRDLILVGPSSLPFWELALTLGLKMEGPVFRAVLGPARILMTWVGPSPSPLGSLGKIRATSAYRLQLKTT